MEASWIRRATACVFEYILIRVQVEIAGGDNSGVYLAGLQDSAGYVKAYQAPGAGCVDGNAGTLDIQKVANFSTD